MLKKIIKLANHLDSKGLMKEADYLDKIAIEIAHKIYDDDEGEEGACEEKLEDELYYHENLSHMHEDVVQENNAQDLVDT